MSDMASEAASGAANAAAVGQRSWLLGLLGEHIGGSLTPTMHEAEAERQGLRLLYRTIDTVGMRGKVPSWPALVEVAAQLSFDGLNVTHPAKQAVTPALDELSEEAELIGAVNTIAFRDGRAIGMNTDHIGFSQALASLGSEAGVGLAAGSHAGSESGSSSAPRARLDIGLGRVVQLGAGGAGAATAYALLREGVGELVIADVDLARAEALIHRLTGAFAGPRMRAVSTAEVGDIVRTADGLLNCTPIGMTGVSETSPIDVAALHPGLWVGDAVYRPLKTVLVRAAEAIGCRAFGGAQMVVGQAAAAFEVFTGRPADRAAMLTDFTATAPY